MRPEDIRQLLTLHEGIRARTYKDTKGKRTIGVGFNLDQLHAEQILHAALGPVGYTNIRSGLVMLTAEQIQKLLDYTIQLAVEAAHRLIPSFAVQPEQAQLVVTDMIFNLGEEGFSKFRRFIAAIESEHYAEAIAQIVNSAYYHEVGARARNNIALLDQIAYRRNFVPEVSSAKSS